jgi:hypothetical protein
LLFEAPLQGLVEPFAGKRLEQVIHGVGLEGFQGEFVEGRGKDHRGGLFEQFEHFKPVDLGHLHVQEDHVRLVLLDGFYPFEPIVAFLHHPDLRVALQVFLHDQTGQRFIVDNQCFHRLDRFFVKGPADGPAGAGGWPRWAVRTGEWSRSW